jgi:hypothetical protein
MPVSPARARQHAAPKMFKGWFRSQGTGEWRVLAEADNYWVTWEQLLWRLPHHNGDALVLPADRVP